MLCTAAGSMYKTYKLAIYILVKVVILRHLEMCGLPAAQRKSSKSELDTEGNKGWGTGEGGA